MRTGSQPAVVGLPENSYPGIDGTTTWNASDALDPCAVGSCCTSGKTALRVADFDSSVAYYVNALGFHLDWSDGRFSAHYSGQRLRSFPTSPVENLSSPVPAC